MKLLYFYWKQILFHRNPPQLMNDIVNENQFTIATEYEINKPEIHKIDSIFDNCIRDCPNKYFQTFEGKCVYDIKHTYKH